MSKEQISRTVTYDEADCWSSVPSSQTQGSCPFLLLFDNLQREMRGYDHFHRFLTCTPHLSMTPSLPLPAPGRFPSCQQRKWGMTAERKGRPGPMRGHSTGRSRIPRATGQLHTRAAYASADKQASGLFGSLAAPHHDPQPISSPVENSDNPNANRLQSHSGPSLGRLRPCLRQKILQ